MFVRAMNLFILAGLLALPLYGARSHFIRPKPPAASDAEHRADLEKLRVPRDEFLVTGQGTPRLEYGDCTRDLAAFTKILANRGLTPIETVTCVPVTGDVESFAPTFRAVAAERLETTTVVGSRYNSQSFCEIEAEKMSVELARKDAVIEAACRAVRGSGLADTEGTLYEPLVILLSRVAAPAETKPYSAIEVLVDSASGATRRNIAATADAEAPAAEDKPAAQ